MKYRFIRGCPPFGGNVKCIGGMLRARFVGRWKITQQMEMTAAAYNIVRLSKLVAV
jgi:hypothetical protein